MKYSHESAHGQEAPDRGWEGKMETRVKTSCPNVFEHVNRETLTRRQRILIGTAMVCFYIPFAHAQQPGSGSPANVSPSQGAEVSAAVKFDLSPPLRSVRPLTDRRPPHPIFLGRIQPGSPVSISPDGAVQPLPAVSVPTTDGLNFLGVGTGFTGPGGTGGVGGDPSDSNGAVGATQFVEWVNTSFAVFDKSTGTAVYGPAAGNTLWTGFGGNCETENDGDPIVQYDKLANRWVLSQFAFTIDSGGNFVNPLECVAVSTSSDATGSYYRYSFTAASLPDYSKLGVWSDAYYLSSNMFGSVSFNGARVCALDRANMLIGAAATQQCFQLSSSVFGLLPSDLDGTTPPPAGSPNYFVSLGTTSSLRLWKFHVDWTTPANSTFTGPTSITVTSYSEACNGGTCIPQAVPGNQLASLGDRLMYRLAYRNFGDHESLVVNHSVTAGGVVGIRWYELRSPGGTPTVYQQSTYQPDSSYRWMGSIAMDGSGDIAMGYSVSSGSMFPSISYTGRLPTDTLSTMGTEKDIFTGAGVETGTFSDGSTASRWGDYTSLSVDPVDDCTFWYTNQYYTSTGVFTWGTRIASFKFPTCGQKKRRGQVTSD